MTGVLLHLTTAVEWRAALTGGVLRPPSLPEAGFVHLSDPGQVHLPAARLFPGRRDVVVLVVDPTRLTDPVRYEPGVPGDPASMRFPHLYGPLPCPAVVAVLPWRVDRPLDLPAPDDAAARAAALALSLPVRRAAQVTDVPGGLAVTGPPSARSQAEDQLLLTAVVGADEVEERTAQLAADHGWPAPAATLLHPGAAPVAEELGRRGWTVAPVVVLAHRSPSPAASGDGDGVVHPPDAQRPRGGPPQVERDRTDRVVRVLDVVVGDGGAGVPAGQLLVDGGTAELVGVTSAPDAGDDRAAEAVVDRALALAVEAGCDLVVLAVGASAELPRWCGRLGFTEVGRRIDVHRPA